MMNLPTSFFCLAIRLTDFSRETPSSYAKPKQIWPPQTLPNLPTSLRQPVPLQLPFVAHQQRFHPDPLLFHMVTVAIFQLWYCWTVSQSGWSNFPCRKQHTAIHHTSHQMHSRFMFKKSTPLWTDKMLTVNLSPCFGELNTLFFSQWTFPGLGLLYFINRLFPAPIHAALCLSPTDTSHIVRPHQPAYIFLNFLFLHVPTPFPLLLTSFTMWTHHLLFLFFNIGL